MIGCDASSDKLLKVAAHLDDTRAELLAFTAFPKKIWHQNPSSNPQERLQGNPSPDRCRWHFP